MKFGADTSLLRIFRELRSQPRPEVLNFQVNDICNARCVMCNIWKNKRGRELTPGEFGSLLQQSYFQNVKHVGITGGEPTLRGDLPRFYHAILTKLPNLSAASFITNGFKTQGAISAYSEVAQDYRAVGKHFSGMVSLDGVGAAHDRVRGRIGAFASATATLFGLREAGIDVHAACTIVRSNIWDIDELLEWGRAHNVYVRFRVGEYIRRLYNLNNRQEIRAFDQAEAKHLVSFFHKLLLDYEQEERVKLTYESILSILTGGPRLVTCPYQTSRALNLDSEGRFAVCAPRGTPTQLGNNPDRSTLRIWERWRVRLGSCPSCIHDYHGALTERETRHRDSCRFAAAELTAAARPELVQARGDTKLARLLIVGWYGTETAGDIAILGGLLLRYRSLGARTFTVLSLYPYYSRMTLTALARELRVNLEVRPYDDPEVLNRLQSYDSVVMAGGPLMDIDPTELVRNVFRRARAQGVRCHIDGCGIGPLNQPRFQAAVSELLELANEVRLRDQPSFEAAKLLAPRVVATVVRDPSVGYLEHLGVRWKPTNGRVIRCWLRKLTHEYPQATGLEESTELLVGFLRQVLGWYPAHRLQLGAMHWFPVGWDDRDFGRDLLRRLANPRVEVDNIPRSPSEILHQMSGADLNLCMRFHSVVFAHSIRAPFVAIDYTAGGKIAGFMTANGQGGRELRYSDLPTLDNASFEARRCGPSTPLACQ